MAKELVGKYEKEAFKWQVLAIVSMILMVIVCVLYGTQRKKASSVEPVVQYVTETVTDTAYVHDTVYVNVRPKVRDSAVVEKNTETPIVEQSI
jgi:hypothetical protein